MRHGIQLIVWTAIGLAIYGLYGYRASRLPQADSHNPAGSSHWHSVRFEALRAGHPAVDVEFLRCSCVVRC